MGSHRHLRFPSMSFIYKCSFRKPEWCFCFSRFGEESFFASTVTRLKPALSVFSIAIELKLIIACKGTDNKLVSQDGFHRTLTVNCVRQVPSDAVACLTGLKQYMTVDGLVLRCLEKLLKTMDGCHPDATKW